MGVAGTSDSVIATEKDDIVVNDKIGCSGKKLKGVSISK